MKRVFLCFMVVGLIGGLAWGTPSTQIWNPSTDIQATGVWHLGIDDYFTVQDRTSGGYAFPTDLGLTYGLSSNLEVGIDAFLPQATPGSPLVFNAKYGLPESAALPALAVGGYGFGLQTGVTDQNVLYAVSAKTFTFGRLSAGYYVGNDKVLGTDNGGVILTWDKYLTDKLWASVDYAGGTSALGALFGGVAYTFAPNTSVIFGYGKYNNGAAPTVTTQLDINI